jgi:hypothetical protein
LRTPQDWPSSRQADPARSEFDERLPGDDPRGDLAAGTATAANRPGRHAS